MQQLMYQWLMFLGISHVLLGVLFAVLANTSLFSSYLQYLFECFKITSTANQDNLLGTMLQLFGVTVASWGVLFSIAVRQYWYGGEAWVKKGVCLAIIIWLFLDSGISLYWGIDAHAYLNSVVGLAMLLPMLMLKPKSVENYSVALSLSCKSKDSKRFLITGGTGFIGKPLVQTLISQQHDVVVLARNIATGAVGIKGKITYISTLEDLPDHEQIDIIINLAGEPLARGRWNKQRKSTFLSSRVDMTGALLKLVQRLEVKPQLLISGSAIGYYGPQDNKELDEQGEFVDSFSHQLCSRWEQEALKFRDLGLRVCLLRLGIVLGKHGGPMKELEAPFNFKIATQLGNGAQWVSWVHLDDVIAMIFYMVAHESIEGGINITAPHPVTNQQFTACLGAVKKTWLNVKMPAKLLTLLVGEMAPEVLLTGQKVIPNKMLSHGYQFKYPDVQSCLKVLS